MSLRKKPAADRNYLEVLDDVAGLVDASRAVAARSVNAVMTTTYWLVGRRIVEGEQRGQGRADYGTQLLERLGDDLTRRFGRGFGRRNLALMRSFFLDRREILQTPSAKSLQPAKLLPTATTAFPLPGRTMSVCSG